LRSQRARSVCGGVICGSIGRLATPWLKAAIEENFGGNHSVAVGGPQPEQIRGAASLRLQDIVVRGTGTVVASAPKAESAW
jgi:hypothetical protein